MRGTDMRCGMSPSRAHTAECGRFEFELRVTANMGHCLRLWDIRSEERPLLVWENDDFSLEEARPARNAWPMGACRLSSKGSP